MARNNKGKKKKKQRMAGEKLSKEARQLIKKRRAEMQAPVNDKIVKGIRYKKKDPTRQWTDGFADDAAIQWSTSSKRGTPERKQEKKTFRKLEQNTNIIFDRVPRNSERSDIHINRYGNGDRYFDKKYGDDEWYKDFTEQSGGRAPRGLATGKYSYDEFKGSRKWMDLDVPKTKDPHSQVILSHEIGHSLGLRDLPNYKQQNRTRNKSVMSWATDSYAVSGKKPFSSNDYEAIRRNYPHATFDWE